MVNESLIDSVMNNLDSVVGQDVDYQIGRYVPKQGVEYSVVLQNDGIYEIWENTLGMFTVKVGNAKLVGLGSELTEGVNLKVPKIPLSKFEELRLFYQNIYNLYKSEVYVALYYDTENLSWEFYVPKQSVGAAVVDFNNYNHLVLQEHPTWIRVLETHSHNVMSGGFSGIDDANHQTCDVLHLVIGDIFLLNPSYSLRFAKGNNKVDVKIEDVFDIKSNAIEIDSLFPDWENNISEVKYKPIRDNFRDTLSRPYYKKFETLQEEPYEFERYLNEEVYFDTTIQAG